MAANNPIIDLSFVLSPNITLFVDPPNNYYCISQHYLYFQATPFKDTIIYYEFDNNLPTLSSFYVTSSNPYIQLELPAGFIGRQRNITIVAVSGGNKRSEQLLLSYYIESNFRPSSYGFMVPGYDSGGYFTAINLEMNATVLATSAIGNGVQQFADFNANQGSGTYSTQVLALDLKAIDPELVGFEGGFSGMTHI